MSHRLFLTAAAESDIAQAVGWLRPRSQQAAERFQIAISNALASVAEAPEKYPMIHRDIRRALLKRFPYSVFYVVESDTVVVLAVLHQARHPNAWEGRTSAGKDRSSE